MFSPHKNPFHEAIHNSLIQSPYPHRNVVADMCKDLEDWLAGQFQRKIDGKNLAVDAAIGELFEIITGRKML